MRLWSKKLAVILATGYILFFYSERVFWSFLRPGDKLRDLVLGWLVYSLLAWVFLLFVRWGRVVSFPAAFVAGAVFGWLAEGVVVDTLYGNADNPFPASISFTGLAWHALISVGVGWYAQARVLAEGKPRRVALLAVAVGLGWGLWAGWWPAELGWANTSLLAFSVHSLVCSIPLVLSWVVLGLGHAKCFRPSTPETLILPGLAGLFFLGVRVPATPRSAVILPPLILLCVYALYRNSRREQGEDVLEMTVGQIRTSSCLWLFLMPVSAIVAYAPVTLVAQPLPTNWMLYVITMPLGFLCFLRSIWILVR